MYTSSNPQNGYDMSYADKLAIKFSHQMQNMFVLPFRRFVWNEKASEMASSFYSRFVMTHPQSIKIMAKIVIFDQKIP